MFIRLAIILLFFQCYNAQNNKTGFYYPDEVDSLISNENVANIPSSLNLTHVRQTSLEEYEKLVDRIISGGVTKITLALNKALLQKNSDRNVLVFAPVSISGALALVLLGSNGKTFQELSSIMGLASGVVDIQNKSLVVHEQFGRIIRKLQTTAGFDIGHQVNFASAVFVQNDYPIRNVYKTTAASLYESEILNVDFKSNARSAQDTINNWVADRTQGKIRDIIVDTPPEYTKVIITSAMYFKAQWEHPFFDGVTTRRPFYVNGRKNPTNVEAEMMANGGEFPYFRDNNLKCEILGMPYKGKSTTMYVVMPFESNKDKLKELENKLSATELESLADNTVNTRVTMLFPKMKMESTIDLKESLKLLGIHTLFNPTDANLALISAGETVPIPKAAAFLPPDLTERLIFSRFKEVSNCSQIFNNGSGLNTCNETIKENNRQQRVYYKRIENKIGRKVVRRNTIGDNIEEETLDNVRRIINEQSTSNQYQNPGLYVDKIIHKVFMDITETGTEAAAATAVSLTRDGSRVTFRVDVPFFFFIRHEETKTILFWGSVNTPTPHFQKT